MAEEDEDNILYELLVHMEWSLEPELISGVSKSQGGSIFYRMLTQTPGNIWSLTSYLGRNIWNSASGFSNLARIIENGSDWQLGVGAQGAVIVILQSTSLEIRAKRDEYFSIIGKNVNLYNDPFPKWRKVTWSSECSMLAVAYSDGTVEIFNTIGASLFTIYPKWFIEKKQSAGVCNALATLIFCDVRTQDMKWAAELILIDFHGNIRSYFVSPTEGYQESHVFSFNKLYPQGITAAADIGSLLVVAGNCKYIKDSNLRNNGLGHGLSIWRILIDYPYYKQVPTIDDDEYIAPRISPLEYLPFQEPVNYDHIYRLCISPFGRQMVALHISGSISIWDIPSLRKRKFWALQDQPGYNIRDSIFYCNSYHLKKLDEDLSSIIVDVKWWSENAIILARFSGAVTICSVSSLKNLLGESPEFFEGIPQISEANDLSFLGLEIEQRIIKNTSNILPENSLDQADSNIVGSDSGSDEDEDSSYFKKSKKYVKETLYWITDSERFQPQSQHPKLVSSTCRLLSLKSTTPQELFSRKIESEEYGEALSLAKRYNLDCDLVYQQQWKKNEVTILTIQDFLHKIRKRWWVLDECLNRVPDNIDAARELLLYGLKGTELDTLVAVGNEDDDGEFIASELGAEYEENFDLSPEEAEMRAEEWAAEDLKKRKDLIAKIDFENLSRDQVKILEARKKLLQYYDRLATYEVLLGGPYIAQEHYTSEFYSKFRNMSETEAAVDFARNYNSRGVEVMFTYHSKQILPHRLAILSNFPPTMDPFEYRNLLSECDLHGDVFEWEEDYLRDSDWSEDPICSRYIEVKGDFIHTIYKKDPILNEFRKVELSVAVLSNWYKYRVQEIETTSHFIDSALSLLKLGQERNVPDLDELKDAFENLEVLIYEVGLSDLSLKKFNELNALEKFTLFMSSSNSENIIRNLRRWGIPYLDVCEKRNPGIKKNILKQFIVSSSKQDLAFTLKIIQHSQMDQHDRILTDLEDIYQVVVESIYNCEKESELPIAFAILEHLPYNNFGDDNKVLLRLQDEIDTLEEHVMAAEVISQYNITVMPFFIKSLQGDFTKISLFLTKISRTATRREKLMTEEDWRKLLNDLLELQQNVFSVIEPQLCYEILTEALLTSGVRQYIYIARSFLETKADGSPVHNPYLEQVPFLRSVSLVVKAAREYFNGSVTFQDEGMEFARICLDSIESENEAITEEIDLLASVGILPVIGINKLPLEVRLCENRLSLIEEALKKQPENYHLGSQILHLAGLLRVCGDDIRAREGKVLALLAEAAYKADDFVSAGSWCSQIVSGGHWEGWPISAKLGQNERIQDLKLRAKFLDFAITHAASSHLESLLRSRNGIELAILCSKVKKQFETGSMTPDSDEDFEDAKAFHTEDSEEWLDTDEGVPYSTRPLLEDIIPLNLLTSTTTSFVSNVTNKKFWRKAISWMRPLHHQLADASKPGYNREDIKLEKQGCHAFYLDIVGKESHISSLSPSYKSYAPPLLSSLEFSLNLLRVALIEETLSMGSSKQDNNAVLEELSKTILLEDLTLGLSFLLLNSFKEADNVLSSLPTTEFSLQLSQYYYAIQIYNVIYPWKNKGISPVFLYPPFDLIEAVAILIEKEKNSLENKKKLKILVEQFQRVQHLQNDYVQGQALQKLGAGVNIERFLSDAAYKEDTVLGLAMSHEENVFELAVTLANKYDVPLWHVYVTHLQFLFDCGLSTDEIRQTIDQRRIMSILKDRPSEFVEFMNKNIFPALDGKDYPLLILYYQLYLSVGDKSDAVSLSHIKFLEELINLTENLDYKALCDSTTNMIAILLPVLTSKNVDALASMASNLSEINPSLDSSKVYCAWAQLQFFEDKSKHKSRSTSDWISRFNAIKNTIDKMLPDDLELFVEKLTFSSEAVQSMCVESRREIVRRTVIHCKKNTEMQADDGIWRKVLNKFEKLLDHLNLLQSENFQNLLNSEPPLKNYALKFASCGGNEESLESLAKEVLLDMSSMNILRSLLSVYPENALLFPEDVFNKVLTFVLDSLKGDPSLDDKCNFMEILKHLLKELQLYSEEGGELLQEHEVLSELMSFAEETNNPIDGRITVLRVAKEYLPFEKEEEYLLQSLETGDIVERLWTEHPISGSEGSSPTETTSLSIDSESIRSEANRKDLFLKLLENAESIEHCKALLDLLRIWAPFEAEMYNTPCTNPWLNTFEKLLEISSVEENCLDLIEKEKINNDQLPAQCVVEVTEKILSSKHERKLKVAAKMAFKFNNEDAIHIVIDKLKENELMKEDFDVDLLKLIINSENVSRIIHTTLYGLLVNSLIESNDADLLKAACQQLEAANYKLEAVSLSAKMTFIPLGLRTISSFFKMSN